MLALMLATTLVAATGGPLDVIDSVRIVTTADGQGTAFQVTSTDLLTAAHVVGDARTVQISSDGRLAKSIPAQVTLIDPEHDIAVLKIDPAYGSTPLEWGTTPSVGATVYAIGGPIDGLVLSKGRFEGSGPNGLLASSTPVDPGNSGGPLIDVNGAVIGMVIEQEEGTGTAISVPTQQLLRALGSSPATTPRPTGTTDESQSGVAWILAILSALTVVIGISALVMVRRRRSRRNRIVIEF